MGFLYVGFRCDCILPSVEIIILHTSILKRGPKHIGYYLQTLWPMKENVKPKTGGRKTKININTKSTKGINFSEAKKDRNDLMRLKINNILVNLLLK